MFTDREGSKWPVGWEGNGTFVESTRVAVQTSVQAVFIKGLLNAVCFGDYVMKDLVWKEWILTRWGVTCWAVRDYVWTVCTSTTCYTFCYCTVSWLFSLVYLFSPHNLSSLTLKINSWQHNAEWRLNKLICWIQSRCTFEVTTIWCYRNVTIIVIMITIIIMTVEVLASEGWQEAWQLSPR